jgi:hypothetical protein
MVAFSFDEFRIVAGMQHRCAGGVHTLAMAFDVTSHGTRLARNGNPCGLKR